MIILFFKCIPHSWFLSVLFQHILLAPLIHIAVKKQKKISMFSSYCLITVISLIVLLVQLFTHDTFYEGDIVTKFFDYCYDSDAFYNSYLASQLRTFPFYCGFLLAVILDQDFTMSKHQKVKS